MPPACHAHNRLSSSAVYTMASTEQLCYITEHSVGCHDAGCHAFERFARKHAVLRCSACFRARPESMAPNGRRERGSKTIRFIMIGGFLGAGKTTTLSRLARHY